MLSASNIHKKYGAVEVLKGVDIDIRQGEIVSIVGPSGSGKSTLLHILGTLDMADRGHVEIDGVRIESKPEVVVLAAFWWKRVVNWLVDYGLVSFISVGLFSRLLEPALPEDADPLVWTSVFSIVIMLFYFTLLEGLTGQTPGKLVSGTRVMTSTDFSRIGLRTAFYRSLARLIPFEVFSFLFKRPQGWHDLFTNTIVADKKYPYSEKKRLNADQLSDFRNRKIGFVFQFHHLLPEFTALENVCIAGWIHSNKKEIRERAIHLLTILGLQDRLDNKPSQLSGGEQQRVAVARALINRPAIVFADEPTGNLDTVNARELHQLFFDLRKEFNQTFLIVTHNEELARISDRMLTMKDGKMEG